MKKGLKKTLTILIGVLVVCLVSLGTIIFGYLNQIDYVEEEFTQIDDVELQEELDIGVYEENPYTVVGKDEIVEIPKEEDLLEDYDYKEGITNILLIGADTYKNSGYGRSDCVMIATLDTYDNTVKLTSILRDCYVAIPGYKWNKINAAYAFGGPDLLMSTVTENLGIPLDKYVYVNFGEFEDIIDILGGVDISLTQKETSHVFGTTKEEGDYHLNGKEALNYVRIRKIDSDFYRTSRQRTVMTKIFETYKSKNTAELISMVAKVLPTIHTNLTKIQILELMKTALDVSNIKIEEFTVPAENTWSFQRTSSGASIISVDFNKNSELLKEFIYGDDYVNAKTQSQESEEEDDNVVITIN